MNKSIWLLLLILFFIFAVIWFWKFSCLCGPTAAVVPAKDKCGEQWSLSDGDKFSLNVADHVSFPMSSANHATDINGVNNGMTKIADYLKANANRSLNITGLSSKNETPANNVGDLGLARANDIKKWLTSKGVKANQLKVNSQTADEACYIDRLDKNGKRYPANVKASAKDGKVDFLKRGAKFSFGTAAVAAVAPKVDEVKKKLVGKNLILYFDTNADDPNNMTPQLKKDFEDINYYLSQVKDARLDVSGHTDDRGDKNYNINLSKDRANFAADYLVRMFKLPKARMDIRGEGPNKPAGSNATPEGRQKNRRVEVVLK